MLQNRKEVTVENVKEKIINTSKDLFIIQGYKDTTTRQIIDRAGIRNGTLYHFFKNKEEIFKCLVLSVLDELAELVDRLTVKDQSPALKYACIIAIDFYIVKKHEQIAELYYEAYSLWTIFNALVERASIRNKSLFHIYNPDSTDEDFYLKTTIIEGAMYGFLTDNYHKGDISYNKSIITMLKLSLTIFNVPEKEIENAITKSLEIIKKKKIVIMGFTI